MLSYRAFVMGIVIQISFGGFQSAMASTIVDQNFSSTPPSFFAALSLTGDTVFAQSFTVGIGGRPFDRSHTGDPWQPIPDPGGREVDFLFRTYVDPTPVPETSTLLLLVSASAILLRKLRYRRSI